MGHCPANRIIQARPPFPACIRQLGYMAASDLPMTQATGPGSGKYSLTRGENYVLYSFMPAAPRAAEPAAPPGPPDQANSTGGRLLGLVRKLIAYGRDLVVSLQQKNAPTPGPDLARRFGTFNIALIVARITRGLAIAAGLESRLERRPPPQEKPRAPRPPAPPRARPARPRSPDPSWDEDDADLLRGLPSAEEIARRIRGRRPGAVIVEICRDLGIDTTHPLWRDIKLAIIVYDGSMVRMLKVWMGRMAANIAMSMHEEGLSPPPTWPGPVVAGAGPP